MHVFIPDVAFMAAARLAHNSSTSSFDVLPGQWQLSSLSPHGAFDAQPVDAMFFRHGVASSHIGRSTLWDEKLNEHLARV